MHKGWSGHFFCAQNEKGSEKMAEITLEFDTIAAISTPPGEGAISIVRLSGDQAVQLADKVYHSGNKRLSEVPSHTIHYGHIVDGYEVIDEVLVSTKDIYAGRCSRNQLSRRDRRSQSNFAVIVKRRGKIS